MRQLKWDVPFADHHPWKLEIASAKLDGDGCWAEVRSLGDTPETWFVFFSQVTGVKYSNESFFDWNAWATRLESSHQAAAYSVEDGDWRGEFWSGRDTSQFPTTHYAIATTNCLLEVLAAYADLLDPEEVAVRRERFDALANGGKT